MDSTEEKKEPLRKFRKKLFYSFIKRLFDIIFSFIAIILFSWLFIILAILVKITSKGPVFFAHKRIGMKGKTIKVWKFRTMFSDNRRIEDILTPEQLLEYKKNYKLSNDPRVTGLGKILRKTSLDEIPQLFNVFFGNMSFVGPRPVTEEETLLFKEYLEDLIKVKPGITGYWATHGRSNVSYDERIELEMNYVYKRSILMDINIMLLTFFKVLKNDGI